jgi:O-acetyl-ADP-ribose deacetylase (regulator of RNase III)
MGQDLRTDVDAIGRTTSSCLRVADELGARSLALPAFGTGVGGVPVDEAAEAMVAAIRAYEPRSVERAIVAVYGQAARRAFEEAIGR